MSRTKSTVINMKWSLFAKVLELILKFITRIIFIKTLGSEYLGLNGLFSNILTVLSLAELGIGSAITYGLYKPLANNDIEKIKTLMNLFKIVYRIIGIIILILGCSITPFLNVFIKEIPSINNIQIIYILFVINTAVSYFYSFKSNLVIADQKRYIAIIYQYVCRIIMNIIQVIYLFVFKNFIGYLIIQIIFTVLENILISIKANRMYPYLKEKNINKLDKRTKKNIVENTKALVLHKIGGVCVGATDNIIISTFIGLVPVGIYSNYTMITSALKSFISQIYNSIIASVGNLFIEGDKNKIYKTFTKVNFLIFTIAYFSSIFLMTLSNEAITIMSSKEYLFKTSTVFIIVINFYLDIMREAVLSFRDAAGLFYKDKYKSICESLINLVFSIILVKKIGIAGVLLGTTISYILTCVWIEPYVLYKYCFNLKLREYFKDYVKYLVLTIMTGFAINLICSLISYNTILNLIIKFITTSLISLFVYWSIFYRKDEFKYFVYLFKNIVKRKLN